MRASGEHALERRLNGSASARFILAGEMRPVVPMDWVFAILWIVVGALLFWGGERLVRRLRGDQDRASALAAENAAHVFRIKSLEGETALIPGLRAKIAELEARPPTIVEKPVVKMIERPFDNTATMTRLQSLEKEAARIPDLKARIAELQSQPPKIVERMVDNPEHVARIQSLEAEVAIIPDLKAKIAELEARAPETVERIVERPIDNPEHLARIRRLEEEADVIPGLRARIDELERRPPEIIERPVERIVERLVDNPVHVAKIRALEKEAGLVPGLRRRIFDLQRRAAEDRDRRLRDLERRFDDIERALRRRDGASEEPANDAQSPDAGVAGTTIDVAAAKAEGFPIEGPNDLSIIAGLDSAAADALHRAGAGDFATIAAMTPAEILQVMRAGGATADLWTVESWPEQADLAAQNHWRALKALQGSLTAD